MSGSHWARFWKRESDEDSLGHCVGEKQSVQEGTRAVNVGPGGLSFEESALVHLIVGYLRLGLGNDCLRRQCWRAWPSSRCHLMHPSHRRMHHRYWHLLDAVLDSEWSGIHRGIAHALGARVRPLVLWVIHLARVWDHVSTEWRGKGVLGGCLSKTEIPFYGGLCCECDIAWV